MARPKFRHEYIKADGVFCALRIKVAAHADIGRCGHDGIAILDRGELRACREKAFFVIHQKVWIAVRALSCQKNFGFSNDAIDKRLSDVDPGSGIGSEISVATFGHGVHYDPVCHIDFAILGAEAFECEREVS